MSDFSGRVLFLDRSDINTDEIIPARYLSEIEKDALGPHLLEDLSLEGFDPSSDISGRSAIITRSNFGCGSSREHAPWALEANGIKLVIAESFARIFRQNMFNCGMMAVELSPADIGRIFEEFSAGEACVETDLDEFCLIVSSGSREEKFYFTVSEFDLALVKAGGWVEYADLHY